MDCRHSCVQQQVKTPSIEDVPVSTGLMAQAYATPAGTVVALLSREVDEVAGKMANFRNKVPQCRKLLHFGTCNAEWYSV